MYAPLLTLRCLLVISLAVAIGSRASAAPLTYQYAGEITEVTMNEDQVIPNLGVGSEFSGYVTFEATGWQHTSGTVFAALNGVELLFTGQYIYGDVDVQPSAYSIRIAGDTGGAITGSTFNAGNFGPELIDSDGSAGYVDAFPLAFDLSHFEVNVFRISGTVLGTGDRLSATGRLTEFARVPEPRSLALIGTAAIAALCWRRQSATF